MLRLGRRRLRDRRLRSPNPCHFDFLKETCMSLLNRSGSVGQRALALVTIAIAAVVTTASPAGAAGARPTLYTLSNSPTHNQVLIFEQGAGGSLGLISAVDTGGVGTGAGLGKQGALALNRNERWL